MLMLMFALLVAVAMKGAPPRNPQFDALAADVRESLELARIPLSAAAIDMGIKHPQLTKQLAGEGHLSLRRLANLPVQFHQWFAVVRARRLGVPTEVVAAQQLQRFAQQESAL